MFFGEYSQQNKPKRKLHVKAPILQSGSDQFKDAKVSRFGIHDFHGHIQLVFIQVYSTLLSLYGITVEHILF